MKGRGRGTGTLLHDVNILTSDSSKEQLLNECIKIEQFIRIFPFSYQVTIPLSRKDYEIITLCTQGKT
jgi:hypothetical protein